jgi:protocatechuate 3,4-dioxygenase beta subunit
MTRSVLTGLAGSFILAMVAITPVSGQLEQVSLSPPSAGQPQRDPNVQPSVRRVPVGTAVITGTVTAADSGRPLRGVRINLNGMAGPPAPLRMGGPAVGVSPPIVTGRIGAQGQVTSAQISASRTAITDAQGEFVLSHLPAGQYSVSASRNTFLTTNYGQKKPQGPGTTVALADGQKLALNMQLLRGGVISGTVFGEDGEPLAQTQVQVWRYAMNNGVKRLQRSNGASTDDRGTYRISNLQPGEYIVSATVTNSDAMMSERMLADMVLIEQAIAAGAVQAGAAPGMPATVAIPVPAQSQNRTLDSSPPGFVPVFHPSTIDPRGATMLRVVGGDEHRFIDVQLRLAQASNVIGSIANPPGQDLGVQLVLMNDDPMVDTTTTSRTDANGQFIFRNVAPGKYTIQADVISAPQPVVVNGVSSQRIGPMPLLGDEQKMWGRESVVVDGQGVVPVSVTLRQGRTISGTVVFDMERPPDLTRTRLTVSLAAAQDTPQMRFSPLPQAQVGPDGRFTLTAVSPGRYQIRPSGAWPKSSMVEGKDTLDFPFDFSAESDVANVVLTVTDKVTEIAGTLTDTTGQLGVDQTVIIAAVDEKYWTPGSRRIAFTRTRADGQYRFGSLPPGDYVLAVVTDLEYPMQYDPDFLKALSAAGSTRLTISEGEKVIKDLRVSR